MSGKTIYILCLLLWGALFLPSSAEAAYTHPAVKANLNELQKLDSLIARQNELKEKKMARINDLRNTLSRATDLNERLILSKKLFQEFRYFDTDSALNYSRKMHDLACQMRPVNDSLVTMTLIDQAYIHSIQGFHSKAAEILNKISPSSLVNTEVRLKYYKAKEYGASMELVYASNNKEASDSIWKKLLQYRDSLSAVSKLLPDDRFLWMPIAEQIDGGDLREIAPEALNNLKLSIDTVSDLAQADAPGAFWLARYYQALGDSVNMIRYLAISSRIKIMNQYRENPALSELSGHLFDFGDLDRAFDYIMYSGEQIKAYKNRNRIVLDTSLISDVKDAYNAKLKERDRILRLCVTILIVFALVLVFFVIALINRNKKLHSTRDRLAQVNSELVNALSQRDTAITSLKSANDKLEQLNKMKHEVIALAFHLAAIQIGRLNEFRKKLLRKYKTNQFADMGGTLNNDDIIKEYYADLNKAFDKTVISTFPEFIEEYNKNCAEGDEVDIDAIKKSQTLNVRLRIYALRRLGVEKSADLAQILNVSIRTVYNNRSTDPKTN